MRAIFFNSVGGASGDMILGALIGLGVDPEELSRELASLVPEELFAITAEPFLDYGLQGLQARVDIHEHRDHGHDHAHGPDVAPHHHHRHAHRGLTEITAMIEGSSLPGKVKEMSLQVFRRLAEAEAKVHGTTPELIHFHEVGAVDSIIDIVGCCYGLHQLGVTAVGCGPLPLGCGTTTCMHGVIPVPVPATLELIRGMKVVHTGEPFELVTPTGAALLSTWCGEFPSGGRVVNASYSFGQRRLTARPNVIRAELYEWIPAAEETDCCTVLECNIDDCSPEIMAAAFDRLLEAGALDVFTQPVQMKKQRQGLLLTVICDDDRAAALETLIFRETTTFGIRRRHSERVKLDRRLVEVATAYGSIRIKVGKRGGEDITFSPEYEDCAAAAVKASVAVREVFRAAMAAFAVQRGEG